MLRSELQHTSCSPTAVRSSGRASPFLVIKIASIFKSYLCIAQPGPGAGGPQQVLAAAVVRATARDAGLGLEPERSLELSPFRAGAGGTISGVSTYGAK